MIVKSKKQIRLPGQLREQAILEEAVNFFAETGFEGQTRILAERLGVTQPLLYRYFPTKEILIQRVYEYVYDRTWKEEWEEMLGNAAIPLAKRISGFYKEFFSNYFTYVGIRIFLFAGLKGFSINRHYSELFVKRVVIPVCEEIRKLANLPSLEKKPLSPEETEVFWALHGALFYRAIRKWVYSYPQPDNLEQFIEINVENFIMTAPSNFKLLSGS